MRILMAVLLAVVATPALAGDGIARLAWLSNCWAADGGEAGSGEQWTTPAGGQMLGMARTVQDDTTRAFEFMRIVERDDGLVFIAQPNGAAPVEFNATDIGDAHVVFENPENDFPQRVLYRLTAPGLLHARIEGATDDPAVAMDFPLRRVSCDAGPFLDDGPLRGLDVFDVDTLEEARELTATDPAVQAGRLEMELRPWYGAAALKQLIELYPRTTKQAP